MSKKGFKGVKFNPRGYQRDALRAIWKAWHRNDAVFKKVLAVLPTGCGKTILFSMITNHEVKNEGRKVLILAHRDELIRQAQDKLMKSTGLDSAIEKASESGVGTFHNVIVASVQTLSNDKRLNQYAPDHFDTIIIDESHRALAKTYQKIFDYFLPHAKILGVTATPSRGDKQSLGKFFEVIAYEYLLSAAIEDGWLSPIRARTCPVEIDISNCKVSAGDYQLGDLGNALTPYLESIADQIVEHASDRKTLLFLPLVDTSRAMADILTSKGITCQHIDGTFKDEDRKDALDWYRNAPRGTALCNSMLLTEGFDQEDIDCVVVLRPTKSTGLYCQMVGRGTRVLDPEINNPELDACQRRQIIAASAKKDVLVLDFLWHSANHRLCSPASLSAHTEDIQDRMDRIQKDSGESMTLGELEEEAHNEVRLEREAALARMLEASKGKEALVIDPVVHAL